MMLFKHYAFIASGTSIFSLMYLKSRFDAVRFASPDLSRFEVPFSLEGLANLPDLPDSHQEWTHLAQSLHVRIKTPYFRQELLKDCLRLPGFKALDVCYLPVAATIVGIVGHMYVNFRSPVGGISRSVLPEVLKLHWLDISKGLGRVHSDGDLIPFTFEDLFTWNVSKVNPEDGAHFSNLKPRVEPFQNTSSDILYRILADAVKGMDPLLTHISVLMEGMVTLGGKSPMKLNQALAAIQDVVESLFDTFRYSDARGCVSDSKRYDVGEAAKTMFPFGVPPEGVVSTVSGLYTPSTLALDALTGRMYDTKFGREVLLGYPGLAKNLVQVLNILNQAKLFEKLTDHENQEVSLRAQWILNRMQQLFDFHLGRMMMVILPTTQIGRSDTSSVSQELKSRTSVSRSQQILRELQRSNMERGGAFFEGRCRVEKGAGKYAHVILESPMIGVHVPLPGDTVRLILQNEATCLEACDVSQIPERLPFSSLSLVWQQHLLKLGIQGPFVSRETWMRYVDLASFDGTFESCKPLIRYFSVNRYDGHDAHLYISVHKGGYTEALVSGHVDIVHFEISRATAFTIRPSEPAPLLFGMGTGASPFGLFLAQHPEARAYVGFSQEADNMLLGLEGVHAFYTEDQQGRMYKRLRDVCSEEQRNYIFSRLGSAPILICGTALFVHDTLSFLRDIFSEFSDDPSLVFDQKVLATVRIEQFNPPSSIPQVLYTASDLLKKVMCDEGIWVTAHGKVYNLTDYARVHPGGPLLLHLYNGCDISSVFHMLSIHHKGAVSEMESYCVGYIPKVEHIALETRRALMFATNVFKFDVDPVVSDSAYHLLRACGAIERWCQRVASLEIDVSERPMFPFKVNETGDIVDGVPQHEFENKVRDYLEACGVFVRVKTQQHMNIKVLRKDLLRR